MREKLIRCQWECIRPLETETVFISDSMHVMEREVHGQEIVFEGDGLIYGNTYTITIRDAEAKVTLKSTFRNNRFIRTHNSAFIFLLLQPNLGELQKVQVKRTQQVHNAYEIIVVLELSS